MERKIRAVQYGCGKMAAYIMQYAIEKGVEFVAAFGRNPNTIGKDIGELVANPTEKYGVVVQHFDFADSLLEKLKPDICIVSTRSLLQDVKNIMMTCAKYGINVITTSEEAFFPWNSSHTTTRQIDLLAKKTGATISGSGYQDFCYGNLVAALSGCNHKITKITGTSSYNVDDYGLALAEVHGVGLDIDSFSKTIASADNISEKQRNDLIAKEKFLPSFMWSANGWIAAKLGLTVTRHIQKSVPLVCESDLYSKTLHTIIPKGYCKGMAAVAHFETAEGITIESECVGKVYNAEDKDTDVWKIYGTPDNIVEVVAPHNVEITCAIIVNRIPDVINAPGGFSTTDKMPLLTYRAKNLQEYIK